MASLTIYLDEETLSAVERAAKKEGCSISSWARHHLYEAAKLKSGWPEGYFETIQNFGETSIREVEEIPIPLDAIDLDSEE